MTSYIGNQPSGQGQAERFIFTCTGTTPTITHDTNGVPISYTPGQVSVYLNGVKQVVGTDVTATNGSTVVFAANLAVSDVVEVIALSTFAAATTEGTSIQSTGETGNVKFLGEDGDNSSSWKQIDSGSIATGAIDEAHIANDAVNFATHLKAGTDGELITWDASGDPAAVAVGTSGHVLTSGGAGVAPTFQAAGGGAAGSSAFLVGKSGAWATVASGSVVDFSSTSGEGFNTGGDFGSVETNAYTAPAAGVYIFGYHMYSNTSSNASTWTFAINDTDLAIIGGLTVITHGTDVQVRESTVCLSLSSGDEVDVRSELANSAFYGSLSYFWGCRLS